MAQAYRCVLEVLKWLAPREVLYSACSVSALWMSAADAEELWNEMMHLADFSRDEIGEKLGSAKLYFREVGRLRRTKICFIPARTSVRVFNCQRNSITKIFEVPAHTFSSYCAVVVLSHREAFICGGAHDEDNTKSISLLTGTVTLLGRMTAHRANHSAVFVRNTVYAFGGIENNTAEKFPMASRCWQQVSSMHTPRSSFNASLWGHMVYLCGGHTRECETFDLDTEEFAVMALRLNQSNWTVSFFYQRELVVIAHSEVYFVKQEKTQVRRGAMKLIP